MRVVSYRRVSSAEQINGYSLEAQSKIIRRFCEQKGHAILTEYADEGRSAKTDSLSKRPGFQAAMEAVKSGRAEAIVVHKPDRAARNLRLLLETLYQLNGGIIAVEGDFDYSSPEGRLRAHILGSVAQWFSDNLSQEVKKGKDERRRQGLYHGKLPFGIRKNPLDDRGKLPPVPDSDPVLCTVADRREWSRFDALRHLFERAAAGASTPTLAEEMHALGFPLGLGTIWEVLTNRFYLGELPMGKRRRDGWLPGAHAPFIDQRLFDAAAKVRAENRRGRAAVPRSSKVYALTGLCRCGRCGDSLHSRTDRQQQPMLFCHTRQKRHGCDQPWIRAVHVEEQLQQFVQMCTPPKDLAGWIASQVRSEGKDTRRERTNLEKRLRRLRDLYEWGDLESADFLSRKGDLERQLAMLEPVKTDSRTIDRLLHYLQDFTCGYRDATPDERNQILRALFSVVMVDDVRVTKVGWQPAFDRLIQASQHAEALGVSGQSERVFPLVRGDDGLWVVPPLEIRHSLKPRIPRECWPDVLQELADGVLVPDLAERWHVHERTMWRTIAAARGSGTQ